jgi:putative hemolysin
MAVKILGLGRFQETYAAARAGDTAQSFPKRVLDSMGVTYRTSERDHSQIPREGPCVVVANHPFGLLEAVVLVTMLREIRPDVRALANELLSGIPELNDVVIHVDVLRGDARANVSGMRRALEFVSAGGLLLMFPAGEVSHFQWSKRAAIDPAWSPTVARLIRMAARACQGQIQIVPVFVPGTNSLLFHAAGMAHPKLRTALLAHEFNNKKRRTIELHIGRPVGVDKLFMMDTDEERIRYLRWRTYLLADRESLPSHPKSVAAPTEPVPATLLISEILALPTEALLERSGDLEVYLTPATPIPNVLRELGRLREITFREVGEGTGHSIDLDRFDWYYLHLFVWNARKQEIAGAYRLQTSDVTADLYTRTLFRYDEQFLNAMGPALELGRSFIRPEYQKGFAPLLLLWKGIGKFVARHPRYKMLFGPVSISNRYPAAARDMMIQFLEKEAGLPEWTDLVKARNAPQRTHSSDAWSCRDLDELSELIADLDPAQPGVPVLLRQYLRLGGKLLGFNVDPDFSNALDGLIVVDLTKTEPKLRDRYLGKAEAASFLEFHARAAAGPVSPLEPIGRALTASRRSVHHAPSHRSM